jgi:DNA repair protein RadA/Sms
LAVAAALVSALSDQPVPAETVVFGEIGLSGEVRAVGRSEARLKEAAKLGFSRALVPARRTGAAGAPGNALKVESIEHVQDLVGFFPAPRTRRAAGEYRSVATGDLG